jgi:hypothetical protein
MVGDRAIEFVTKAEASSMEDVNTMICIVYVYGDEPVV